MLPTEGLKVEKKGMWAKELLAEFSYPVWNYSYELESKPAREAYLGSRLFEGGVESVYRAQIDPSYLSMHEQETARKQIPKDALLAHKIISRILKHAKSAQKGN